ASANLKITGKDAVQDGVCVTSDNGKCLPVSCEEPLFGTTKRDAQLHDSMILSSTLAIAAAHRSVRFPKRTYGVGPLPATARHWLSHRAAGISACPIAHPTGPVIPTASPSQRHARSKPSLR